MIAVAVTDTMKVTANVITTATTIELSESSLSPASSPDPVNQVNTNSSQLQEYVRVYMSVDNE